MDFLLGLARGGYNYMCGQAGLSGEFGPRVEAIGRRMDGVDA